ncbi:MAG TPA: hypothetical protein VFB73_11520 [Chloroflexota bacterium]|nr:hypothetical protein [Chloroflexota bacterium]
MQVIRAERWHQVVVPPEPAPPYCSVCGSTRLTPRREVVFDGTTRARYHLVRCGGCGYDLLQPLARPGAEPPAHLVAAAV